ncbi:hypothetical protein HK099_001373 [Clydaea vesicula]|uniref:DNA-directed RNA polymerase III subunit RPC9 n=1 Tax=Clydaea vesicula TaxID=447962 RepID=A0AAD5XZQ3_9FUNG|nr:hypothetical protein HK099_001373 [Clydaea vesicula]
MAVLTNSNLNLLNSNLNQQHSKINPTSNLTGGLVGFNSNSKFLPTVSSRLLPPITNNSTQHLKNEGQLNVDCTSNDQSSIWSNDFEGKKNKKILVDKEQQTHSEENDEPNSTLPDGWQESSTKDGAQYFIDHLTKTTTWVDPRILKKTTKYKVKDTNGNIQEMLLPPKWPIQEWPVSNGARRNDFINDDHYEKLGVENNNNNSYFEDPRKRAEIRIRKKLRPINSNNNQLNNNLRSTESLNTPYSNNMNLRLSDSINLVTGNSNNNTVIGMSNFDVYNIIREESDKSKEIGRVIRNPTELQDLFTVEFEVLQYFKDSTCLKVTKGKAEKVINYLNQFNLTKAEKIQILNNLPTSLVVISLLIDDVGERFTEEQLNEICDFFKKEFQL